MKIKEFLMQDVSWKIIKLKLCEQNNKYGITRDANAFYEKHSVVIRIILIIIFSFIVFWQSWTCDDAYHSYIMARHFAEGKGLVYNVGYRVTASTCPLLTLIQAGVYKILHNMVATGVVIGVASSAAAAAVLFFKFCTKFRYVIFAFLAMIMSYLFMSFTTSGLENSLLFLLGALFLSCFFQKDEFSAKDLFVLALLLALLAMARMDTVLIFIPMIMTAYLFMTKVKFAKRVGIGFLGLLPFILWEVFSVFYYGFPFPNTLYAKMYAGLPASEYFAKGLTYLRLSFMFDSLLIIIPSLFLLLLIRNRSKKWLLLLGGLIIYAIYIVRIGGDFMAGRFLTLNFFLALCGVCALLSTHTFTSNKCNDNKYFSWVKKIHPDVLAVCCLILFAILSPILKPLAMVEFSRAPHSSLSGIVDQKKVYCENGACTIDKLKAWATDRPDGVQIWLRDYYTQVEQGRKIGEKGFLNPIWCVPGYIAYTMTDKADMYLTDNMAIMDPLLSRMPSIDCEYWRIGHIERIIPDGYIETVRRGENRILDPQLHEYYNRMMFIITGDLFDKKRLKTIWEMNTGKYDYLLEAFKTRIMNSENMPTFEITTTNNLPIVSKKNYINGTLTVTGASDGFELMSEPLHIRGRGNQTWTVDKKSFRIKFDKKLNLLNQGKRKAKSWTLLANHCDKSLLRNEAAYFFASKLGNIPFVSSSSFVELHLNGEYLGVYEVCDQIQVNKARVDIDDSGEEDDIGYLVELDRLASEDVIEIRNGDTFEIKSNYKTQSQMNYIANFLSNSYEAILTKDKKTVEQFIDIPSAVDTYIVEEFFKNIDVGWGSFYFTKPKEGKLYFGPVWDFDISAGNIDETKDALNIDKKEYFTVGKTLNSYKYSYVGNKDIMLAQQNLWFVALRECDWFNELVKNRWNEVKPHAYQTVEHIGELANKYKKSFNRNFYRWYIFDQRIHVEPDEILEIKSFTGQVEYLQKWLLRRIEWLTDYFDGQEKDIELGL